MEPDLNIISPALLNANMAVHRGVPSGSSKLLSVPIPNMTSCPSITEWLGETEVYEIDKAFALFDVSQNVFGLQITMD
jgi:hypothetical protein